MRYLITLVIVGLSTAGAMLGIQVGPSPQSTYVYTLVLPNISSAFTEDDSAFTDYAFSWVGPLQFNAAPNSACPTVCGPVIPGSTVQAGAVFNGFSFTSAGTDPEVDLSFMNPRNGTLITFDFIEPDAFWATPGLVTFGANSQAPPSGVGASFAFQTADPPCNDCSVVITSTPEPGSAILCGTVVAGVVMTVLYRRRQRSI